MTDSDPDTREKQRTLDPEEQSTAEPSGETDTEGAAASQPGGSTPDSRTDAERLADELGWTDLRTTEEGYVEAEVVDLTERDDDTIDLTVRLPTGEEPTFSLEKPLPWSDSFLFARIVEDAGYDATSVEHFVGETVYLERVDHPESDHSSSTGVGAVPIALVKRALGGGSPTSQRSSRSGVPIQIAESILGSFGTTDGTTRDWRLVDPAERSSDEGWSIAKRLLLAGVVTAISFIGIVLGSLAAVTAFELSGLLVFFGAVVLTLLLLVSYLGYAALLLFDRFAS